MSEVGSGARIRCLFFRNWDAVFVYVINVPASVNIIQMMNSEPEENTCYFNVLSVIARKEMDFLPVFPLPEVRDVLADTRAHQILKWWLRLPSAAH